MIIAVDAEKAFNKIRHSFMKETFNRLWKKIYRNIVKATYDKPTANITLDKKKKLEVFPLRSEIIQEGFPGDAVDKNPPANASSGVGQG